MSADTPTIAGGGRRSGGGGRRRGGGGRRATGWIPNQHGAWAMLVVPFLLGASLRWRDGAPTGFLLPLFACWMLGYFAFHAASGWLKAPPARRHGWERPLLTYALASGVAGVAALLLAGWPLLGWAPMFLPLLAPALWLASRRNERATIGGALTIAAASLMIPIARHPALPDAVAPGSGRTWIVAALVFGYFFGTVLYVKTNIRERGRRGWLAASIGYHAAWTVASAMLAWQGLASWWWMGFFAATTVRAWLIPSRGWTPKRIGILEAVFSAVLVVLFWVWPGA